MFTVKFIKNIVFNGETIRAIGRSGSPTRVFVQQGDLDGSCSVYCLMMMLIFYKKLDWEDLTDSERAKESPFVDNIQRQFLYDLRGLCQGGHEMDGLSDKLNLCFEKKLSEVFTTRPGQYNSVSRPELHQRIKAKLDARKAVLVSFQRKTGMGHSVVAVGYRKEKRNLLRLFCIDPGRILPYMQMWNNVIDIDFLSTDNHEMTDYNHYEEDKICVTELLLIHDKPSELACPF